jgi:hypothetical protein
MSNSIGSRTQAATGTSTPPATPADQAAAGTSSSRRSSSASLAGLVDAPAPLGHRPAPGAHGTMAQRLLSDPNVVVGGVALPTVMGALHGLNVGTAGPALASLVSGGRDVCDPSKAFSTFAKMGAVGGAAVPAVLTLAVGGSALIGGLGYALVGAIQKALGSGNEGNEKIKLGLVLGLGVPTGWVVITALSAVDGTATALLASKFPGVPEAIAKACEVVPDMTPSKEVLAGVKTKLLVASAAVATAIGVGGSVLVAGGMAAYAYTHRRAAAQGNDANV